MMRAAFPLACAILLGMGTGTADAAGGREWIAPKGPASGPAPVILLRAGGPVSRLDGGLRALDIHAMFLLPTAIEGIGNTRHLEGRFEYDCKGKVRIHYSSAQHADGTTQPIDVTTPWGPLPSEDEARPCHGAAAEFDDPLTLAEAETQVLVQAREGADFGPAPQPIGSAPELKEVCSLVRKGKTAMRFYTTASVPLRSTSPLVALEAAASRHDPGADTLEKNCLPAGRLADQNHDLSVESLRLRAAEDGIEFSEERR